jgi:hypothetical protein
MNDQLLTMSPVATPDEAPAENRLNVYQLQVGGIDFGYLFLSTESYTLTWPGELDFHYIDETAHYFLFRQLDEIRSPNPSVEKHATDVSLVVGGDLKQFDFDQSPQRREYRTLLEEPDSIAFARYDFHLDKARHTYSFSAENRQHDPSSDGEMAILLPRSKVVAKGLFRWVIKNHAASRRLRLTIDFHNSYGELKRLLESPGTGGPESGGQSKVNR